MGGFRIKIYRKRPFTFTEIVIYYYLFVTLFNTIFVQIQMLMFGEIIIDTAILGSLTLFGIYIQLLKMMFFDGKIRKDNYSLFLLFLYSIFSIIYYMLNGATIHLVSNFVYKKILPLFFVIIILSSNRKIDCNHIIRMIEIFAFFNIIFGLLQFFMDDLIWPFIRDAEGNNLFWSIRDSNFSRIRPPGLMNSALTSGYVTLIWICIVLSKLMTNYVFNKRVLRIQIAKLILAVTSILCSQTRNIYMALIYILMYFFITMLVKQRKIVLPLLNIIPIVIYMCVFVFILPAMKTWSGIWSNGSSLIRYFNWIDMLDIIRNENLTQIAFGIMKWQEIDPGFVFSDNLYFDQFFAMGLIGLVLYLVINFNLQTLLIRYKFLVPFSALLASILFVGVANIPNSVYESTIFIIAALFVNNIRSLSANILE